MFTAEAPPLAWVRRKRGSDAWYPNSALAAGVEKVKLAKELEKLNQHIAGTEARLANTAFTSKAPAAVLEGAKKQLADLQAKRAEVERLLKALG